MSIFEIIALVAFIAFVGGLLVIISVLLYKERLEDIQRPVNLLAGQDFAAWQYGPTNDALVVDVIAFNGDMAVCPIHNQGPVIINKQQAMDFFNLKEA